MLSLSAILNPVTSQPRGTPLPSSPPSSTGNTPSIYDSPVLSIPYLPGKQKMTRDVAVFSKGKIKGEVNYPPQEHMDEVTRRKVQKFHVYPLGKIREYCRHIPYNSEKKGFLEKTGRESFEVFQYTFKVPNDDKEYTVMWDYNVGLVRITPFFKCCKFSKTHPAKMLNMNPGLKQITHSITGGALAAQGYWMPYTCALAICATFCSHISPALVPIFGSDFPSKCVSPEAPEHGRMVIDRSIIIAATAEAEAYRLRYSDPSPVSSRNSYSPKQPKGSSRENYSLSQGTPLELGRRARLKRPFAHDSPSMSNTDTDTDVGGSETSAGDRYLGGSPLTPVSAVSSLGGASQRQQSLQPLHMRTFGARQPNYVSHVANAALVMSTCGIQPSLPQNQQHYQQQRLPSMIIGPNPLLSAVPRSRCFPPYPRATPHQQTLSSKRVIEEVDADDEYDGEESGSLTDEPVKEGNAHEKKTGSDEARDAGAREAKAAVLLMRLSVKDGESSAETPGMKMNLDGPRVKRRRAMSM